MHSCTLVCRVWAPVARRYLLQTLLSRVWVLAVQRSESIGSYLSIPPAAYPFLCAARSMLRNFLPKALLHIAFSSVTFIELGSQVAIIACDVDGLCRTIASLDPLRNLGLVYLAWADSGSNHSRLPETSPSRARLSRIDVRAERSWLLDIRSVHFITWLAHSGTASELTRIHFEWMMILEKRLLAAVAAVVDASNSSLRELFLGVGPDLAICSREYPWSFPVDP